MKYVSVIIVLKLRSTLNYCTTTPVHPISQISFTYMPPLEHCLIELFKHYFHGKSDVYDFFSVPNAHTSYASTSFTINFAKDLFYLS